MVLVDDKGLVVKLGREVAKGGEGAIHEIHDNKTRLAKIYNSSGDRNRTAKLKHLLQSGSKSLSGIAAWPNSLLYDSRDKSSIRGFIMNHIEGKEIHRLYGPKDRHSEFPDATWDYLIHVASNCAAAFETLHENGVVMADVNEKNLLVTNNGEVRLIDCDSYQVKSEKGHFLCNVRFP